MKRKPHTPEEKAKLVIEAFKGERTINEIASANGIHPNMLSKWKREAERNLSVLFGNDSAKKRKEQKEHDAQLQELYAQTGRLTTQVEWLKKNLACESPASLRRTFVNAEEPGLSITEQAELLGISRTPLYYKPVPPSADDIRIKQYIDKVYTAHPEFGSRRICVWLGRHHGIHTNRKAVQRHMREMGIQAVYPRQNTSRPSPSNPVYPYLPKGININHPDHVWGIDITYIPVRTSWLYLTAIIDWYSRYVTDWAVDDTLGIDFVLETSRNALKKAVPEIMNSDQGSHFTGPRYTSIFLDAGARISMGHRGRAYDNIFIERLWRSVKYENVYPQEYGCPREARNGIGQYFKYYNHERPHQSLEYRTPEEVYYGK